MSSPITLSGFNQIDFTTILNAIMQQERQPLAALETQKSALEKQKSTFGTLAAKFSALESAAQDLTSADAFAATSTTVSDSTRLAASSTGTAVQGTYQVYVDQLARAQTSVTNQTFANKDTTAIAGPGTLRFTTSKGNVDVTLTADVTLDQLADAINAQSAAPVSASVVRTTSGTYQLMLTGKDTGAENAFTIDTSAMKEPGGKKRLTLDFTQSQTARDARIRINGVTTTSASNSFQGVISGLSLTAFREDTTNPVMVTITASQDSVVNLVQKVAAAFNEATTFIGEQTSAAARGEQDSIGRDPLVRTLRSRLTNVLTSRYAVGGNYGALAEIGFEFTRSGELKVDEAKLRAAVSEGRIDVEKLFRGSDGTGGVFGALVGALGDYTEAGGLVPHAQDRLGDQLTKLSARISDMEERLAIRRAALQKEFIAADQAIAQLNAQKSSLNALGASLGQF